MNKPSCKLIGENGNIYNLMAIARRALINVGQNENAQKMIDEITSSKSYDEALMIINNYVKVE